MRLRQFGVGLAVLSALVWLPLAACYRPNIAQGGLRCTDGGLCPDGFTCRSNGRCYEGDAEPESICDFPPPASKAGCSSTSTASQACDPVCQTGCACGFCGVTSGAIKCLSLAEGTKDVGAICNPQSQSDCKPGLFCRAECQTTTVGRCYQFCVSSNDCTAPSLCNASSPDSPLSLCSLPSQQCDPIALTGCESTPSALACYAENNAQACECPGTIAAGIKCAFASQCVPGYTCISLTATADPTCQKVCLSASDCTPPATCSSPTVGPYGICE
jgi:hypothetical protein